MKLKHKKLKGFTLVELIIVCALFTMILVGAMSILKPVSLLYRSNTEYQSSRAVSDILSGYLEGSLKCADRMIIYQETSATADPTDPTIPFYDESKEADYVTNFVQNYFAGYGTQDVYVLDIKNSEHGKMYLSKYAYDGGTLDATKSSYNVETISAGVYTDYGFDISFSGSTKSLSTNIDVLKLNKLDGTYEANGVNVVSSMLLLNIYNPTTGGAKNVNIYDSTSALMGSSSSFSSLKGNDPTNRDIHIIYTVPCEEFYEKAIQTSVTT